mgnify:CR=1 FL=1
MLMGALMAAVWYIPGWMRTQVPQEGTLACISNAFPEASVEFKAWDGDRMWPTAVENADKESWRLAFEIATMPEAERRELTIVGHSLGGRMTARILAHLAEKGLKIRQAILLAAAIPNNDDDLKQLGNATDLPVMAVCNPDDLTLRYVYAIAGGETTAAFGANGTVEQLANVREYVTPTNITKQIEINGVWAKAQPLKDIANHHALFYLEYMRRLIGGEEPSGETMVPQGLVNINWPVIDAGIWWDVVDEFDGWKLERNKVSGLCRILDPKKVRTAWGKEAEMRAAFEKVKAQLKSCR